MQPPLIAVQSSYPLIPSLLSKQTIMVPNLASYFGILFHTFLNYRTIWLEIFKFSVSNLPLALRLVPLLPYVPLPELVYVRLISRATAVNLVLLATLVPNANPALLDAANVTMVSPEQEPAVRHHSPPTHPPTATVRTVSAAPVEAAPATPDGKPLRPLAIQLYAQPATMDSF
jgi:hypothetical protein